MVTGLNLQDTKNKGKITHKRFEKQRNEIKRERKGREEKNRKEKKQEYKSAELKWIENQNRLSNVAICQGHQTASFGKYLFGGG